VLAICGTGKSECYVIENICSYNLSENGALSAFDCTFLHLGGFVEM